jgi:hypothetical protein
VNSVANSPVFPIRCAGEVAAVAFNDYCGVGVAYNASIGGNIRLEMFLAELPLVNIFIFIQATAHWK